MVQQIGWCNTERQGYTPPAIVNLNYYRKERRMQR